VPGDGGADALAAAQSGRDEVEGVFAVDLGAGGAQGGAAVVAADEELSGGKVAVDDFPDDLAGCGVDVEAVALHPYGPLAAAQALDLPGVGAEVTVPGEGRQVADGSEGSRGVHVRVPPCGATGVRGVRPACLLARIVEGARQCEQAGRAEKRDQRRVKIERMTTAQTATDVAVMATARSMDTRTAPTTRTTAVPPPTRASMVPGVSWTAGRVDAGVTAVG
jgi:hypothetical protein